MSLQVTGKLLVKYETQKVSDKFKKREFVLELAEEINGNVYTNYAKFQLVQNKCEILDRYNEGDSVTVDFNIKGNRWERDGKVNFISNLDAWRISSGNHQKDTHTSYGNGATEQDFAAKDVPNGSPDNLPF